MCAASAAAITGRTEIVELGVPGRGQHPDRLWSLAQEDGPNQILLRNLGGKPLRLQATQLAEGGNRQPGTTHWHEIALYRTQAGQIAVSLRFRRAMQGDLGVHRARIFPDIDAACDWLEQYDAAADLEAGFDVADKQLTGASLVVKAAALRERAEQLDRAYRGLVGEILYHLEAGG